MLGRSPSAQSGQKSFTWWHSKASGAAETAAADVQQGHLALSPCPWPVLATQPVNIDSVARKWKAEMTTLAHSKGRSSPGPDKTRCSYVIGVSLTNKLFRGGENGKQDCCLLAQDGQLILLLVLKQMDTYTLEAYRKKTGRKYTKTFARDGEIATHLIFFICFYYFLHCLR